VPRAGAALHGPAAAIQAGQHNLAHGLFEQALGSRQGVIQAGAFFQLGFIEGFFVDEALGRLAAGEPGGIDFIGDSGGAADREWGVAFA